MDPIPMPPPRKPVWERVASHYYGDTVRSLFLAAAAVLLLLSPLFPDLLPVRPGVTVLLTFVLVIFAGVTNPRQRTTAVVNMFVAALLLAIFEYYAIVSYGSGAVFIVRQAIAIILFFALYYSIKTVRGSLLR